MQIQSQSWKDPLEKEMAIHSSILAWEIPWTEVHGVARVGHDLATKQQLMVFTLYNTYGIYSIGFDGND